MPKNSKIQALRMRCRSISRHTDRLMEEQTASHYAFMRIAIAAPTQGDEPRAGDSRIKFGRIGAGACGRPAGWRTRPFKENNRTSNRGGAERRAAPAHLNYPLFREAEGWRTHCAVPADCGCHAGADHWQFQRCMAVQAGVRPAAPGQAQRDARAATGPALSHQEHRRRHSQRAGIAHRSSHQLPGRRAWRGPQLPNTG